METTSPTPFNLLERANRWIRESIMIKLFSIGFLILILLIPSAWIGSIMEERQERAKQVIDEVASKWSDNQMISGPILVIPYRKQEIIDRGKDGTEVHEHIEKAFFLPEALTINGTVTPEILHRGIFDAVVYMSDLQIKSTFAKPDFKSLSIPEEMVVWNDAHMVLGITDVGGIADEDPVLTVGGKPLTAEPSNGIGVLVTNNTLSGAAADYYTESLSDDAGAAATDYARTSSGDVRSSAGIVMKLNWENPESFKGDFVAKLSLKGSKQLDFIPAGKTTTVTLGGTWNNPSFDGEFIPATREVTESGFNATWKVLHFNRPFSQQWTNQNQQLTGADFGVKLLIPVDQYQKSIRTSKYSVLIILLTFIALFLVEITQKIRIHPFQYILIGAALTIYYTLLLSFSEHVGYNIAYAMASLATVILISLYSTTFLKSTRLVVLFTLVLLVFYTFIFVIILQQDFSLLLGSVGLFLIISLLMYFSRKVKWYEEDTRVGNLKLE
jgi:inner membrane protein